MSRRAWRLVAGVALLVLLALLAPRLGGGSPGSTDGRAGSSSAPAVAVTTAGPTARATVRPTADPDGDPVGDPISGLPYVDPAELPPQARDVLAAIAAGGPFAYPGKDGSTFGNFEGLLPAVKRGFYREYTVPTPGSRDRGARRIITGADPPTVAYWTDDHYATFSVIRGGLR